MATNNVTTCIIHDNGGRPFKVEISNGNSVKVFKLITNSDAESSCVRKDVHSDEEDIHSEEDVFQIMEDDSDDNENHYSADPIISFQATKVFVGIHDRLSSYDPEMDGNSVLLEVGQNEYVSIGWNIFRFKTLSEIIQYESPIGNSDVPYPYARDNQGNYYLMVENVILLNRPNFDQIIASHNQHPSSRHDDPYSLYYNTHYITEPSSNTRNVFKNIEAFYINGNEYNMTSTLNPEEEYERFKRFSIGNQYSDDIPADVPPVGIYIRQNGVLRELPKDEFVSIINEFNLSQQFTKYEQVELVARLW
jgi:hypothetical protein